MPKSITFLLSGSGQRPVGGFKIVYEYANRLAHRGWRVVIIHPTLLWPAFFKLSLLMKIKVLRAYVRRVITREYLPLHWMKIDPRIKLQWTVTLDGAFIPDADFVVACPVESALFAVDYPKSKGKKFYFIQHFEDWNQPRELVEKSWKLPLKKIVIAKWLQNVARDLGEDSVYIPNGLDFSFFKKLKSLSERPPFSICFLYHALSWKGTRFAIAAMVALKTKYPQLAVTVFSADCIPEKLPDFFMTHVDPSQITLRDIYNSSTIFISPSLAEGWPLPPAEAMLCGCVVVATDIGGHREYIQDGVNGIFCQSWSAESIVEKVEYIFNNPEIATRISGAAPASLQKFDWDSRVELFEQALLS